MPATFRPKRPKFVNSNLPHVPLLTTGLRSCERYTARVVHKRGKLRVHAMCRGVEQSGSSLGS